MIKLSWNYNQAVTFVCLFRSFRFLPFHLSFIKVSRVNPQKRPTKRSGGQFLKGKSHNLEQQFSTLVGE